MNHNNVIRKDAKKFEVGDWVERTQGGSLNNHVTKGNMYKVLEYTNDHRGELVWLIDDRGYRDFFAADFFKLSKNHIVKEIIKDL